MHPNTLRRLADNGQIGHIRTGSGQRRYDIDGYLGASAAARVVCYCRVSSSRQKDDLARQVAFMRERFAEAEVVEDCGSGLNFKRRGLRSLLDRSMRGEKLRVVVAHKDRLARFGFELICHVVEQSGGEIVVLDDITQSPERELVEDLVAIVHVFSCRLNGRRSYKSKSQPALSDGGAAAVVQELDRLREVCLQQNRGAPARCGDAGGLESDQR